MRNLKAPPVACLVVAGVAMAAVLGGASSVLAGEPTWLELDRTQPAAATETADPSSGFTLVQDESGETIETRDTIETTETIEESSFPISFGLSYYLYSDYIFRFVNFSEYPGEGREKLNHQFSTDVGFDLGDFGSLSFTAWFEWYAAQKKLDPVDGGQNAQEIDYTIAWSYDVEPIATTLSIGLTWYTFPNAKAANTFEYFVGLEHNDAWMWKWLLPENEDGVLNPTFFLAHDVDEIGGVWMEFGISHTFDIVENFTLTPGTLVAIDGGYNRDDTFRFAGAQVSLIAEYDIGALMQLPPWAGSLTLTGELYFNDAWGNAEDDRTIQDEFWGGMSVNWAWGG
jgi:hypothetical protein